MGDKISKIQLETILSVCQVRDSNGLGCRRCSFNGCECQRAIEALKSQVERPTDIKLNNGGIY